MCSQSLAIHSRTWGIHGGKGEDCTAPVIKITILFEDRREKEGRRGGVPYVDDILRISKKTIQDFCSNTCMSIVVRNKPLVIGD